MHKAASISSQGVPMRRFEYSCFLLCAVFLFFTVGASANESQPITEERWGEVLAPLGPLEQVGLEQFGVFLGTIAGRLQVYQEQGDTGKIAQYTLIVAVLFRQAAMMVEPENADQQAQKRQVLDQVDFVKAELFKLGVTEEVYQGSWNSLQNALGGSMSFAKEASPQVSPQLVLDPNLPGWKFEERIDPMSDVRHHSAKVVGKYLQGTDDLHAKRNPPSLVLICSDSSDGDGGTLAFNVYVNTTLLYFKMGPMSYRIDNEPNKKLEMFKSDGADHVFVHGTESGEVGNDWADMAELFRGLMTGSRIRIAFSQTPLPSYAYSQVEQISEYSLSQFRSTASKYMRSVCPILASQFELVTPN